MSLYSEMVRRLLCWASSYSVQVSAALEELEELVLHSHAAAAGHSKRLEATAVTYLMHIQIIISKIVGQLKDSSESIGSVLNT